MNISFLEFIKRTGIFFICAESILHFAPSGSYQKYVKLLIGMMVLAQFLLPIKAMIGGQERAVLEQQMAEFQQMFEESTAKVPVLELSGVSAGETAQTMVAEEMKSRLKDIAAAFGYVIEDIIIDETVFVIVRKKVGSSTENGEIYWGRETNKETAESSMEVDGRINISPVTIDADLTLTDGEEDGRQGTAERREKPEIKESELEWLRQQFCEELGTSARYLEVVEGDGK